MSQDGSDGYIGLSSKSVGTFPLSDAIMGRKPFPVVSLKPSLKSPKLRQNLMLRSLGSAKSQGLGLGKDELLRNVSTLSSGRRWQEWLLLLVVIADSMALMTNSSEVLVDCELEETAV